MNNDNDDVEITIVIAPQLPRVGFVPSILPAVESDYAERASEVHVLVDTKKQ